MMHAYVSRLLHDMVSFTRAYLLAMVGIAPLTSQAGAFWFVAYMFLLPYGLANIAVFSLGTAVSSNYFLKLTILLVAVGANAYLWVAQPLLLETYSWSWLQGYALLFAETIVLFVLFYLLLERKLIAAWLQEARAAYWSKWERSS